ncbi:centrosomal protein of 95 kDa-like [Saccoglossus kowalevskii]|uniref:Centrosomal protein of 95 kDa-like n=1 Tax=Saccoglossus kowalevskii TaxID=10224 RepID=A0ABM0M8J4_SACKO|nr:PREDICTED: centrosomal protein of 95 kDa-like [Saccoglossus kowalevskii]
MDPNLSRGLNEQEERGFVDLANELLAKFHLTVITSLSEFIPANFIVLYEGILGDSLPGLIQNPITREDEIHNTQKVIDSLSIDVLRTDLSHITADSIVDGDFLALSNLIEIFAGLLEYVMEAISSEGSTSGDVDGMSDDLDGLTSGAISTISDVLKEELGPTYNYDYARNTNETTKDRPADGIQKPADSTADLIRLGDTLESHPSPAKSRVTTEWSSNNGGILKSTLPEEPKPTATVAETTQDLIRDSEEWVRKLQDHREKWGSYSPSKSSTVTEYSTTSSPLMHRKGRTPYSPARSCTTVTSDSVSSSPLTDRNTRYNFASTSRQSPITKTILPSVVASPAKSVTFSDAPPATVDISESVASSRTPGARRRIDTNFDQARTRKTAWSEQADDEPMPAEPLFPTSTTSPEKQWPEGTGARPKQLNETTTPRSSDDRLSRQQKDKPEGRPVVSAEKDLSIYSRRVEDATNLRQRKETQRKRERQRSKPRDIELDVSHHSDSEIDYGQVWNMLKQHREMRPDPDPVIVENEDYMDVRPKYGRSPPRRLQQTNFESALDADAKGPMANIRKQLRKEDKRKQLRTEAMKHLYESHLQDVKYAQKKTLSEKKKKSTNMDNIYKSVHRGGPKASKYRPESKYKASVVKSKVRSKPVSAPTTPVSKRRRKTLKVGSPGQGIKPKGRLTVQEDDLLPTMLQEFPFLHVSPQTAHDMWRKQMRQIEQLAKAEEHHKKKTKTQLQLEEAGKRQEILMNIMRKELAHNQRMRDIRDRATQQQLVKTRVRENRQATARARRYYEDFQLRMRSKMLKRRTKEEQIFKKVFEDGLDIQKNRIKELRKYAREKREALARRQQDEIDSLENYYHDQFGMLSETISKERYELQVRDKAQSNVMEQMKKELRHKMEKEITDLQENMNRDEDAAYFRQLEADRMRQDLQFATYKTAY